MRVGLRNMLLPLLFMAACSFPDYSFTEPDAAMPVTLTCSDKIQGPSETGVDCGGVCPMCSAGQGCVTSKDCDSSNCEDGICREASCTDGIANGAESDVDCGGRCMKLCAAGSRCNSDADCSSGSCQAGLCLAPSCSDRVSNGDESGVDCGGKCAPCVSGSPCRTGADCVSQNCDETQLVCVDAGCQDTKKNGQETDVDCGGKTCAPCVANESCLVDSDCDSDICDVNSKRCIAASCTDRVLNQDETDLDCGGSICGKCADGRACKDAGDCASGVCQARVCVPASATGISVAENKWQATASDTFSSSKPEYAIDGDVNTRWTSGRGQAPGLWFELDLGEPEIFFSIVIDSSQFASDEGASYNIYFSNDGTFGTAARSAVPGSSITTVKFDSAVVARYVKIELATANASSWWSIGEVHVYQ